MLFNYSVFCFDFDFLQFICNCHDYHFGINVNVKPRRLRWSLFSAFAIITFIFNYYDDNQCFFLYFYLLVVKPGYVLCCYSVHVMTRDRGEMTDTIERTEVDAEQKP